jgi:hypothetical protein
MGLKQFDRRLGRLRTNSTPAPEPARRLQRGRANRLQSPEAGEITMRRFQGSSGFLSKSNDRLLRAVAMAGLIAGKDVTPGCEPEKIPQQFSMPGIFEVGDAQKPAHT